MSAVTISIIVPTIGRSTLERTLTSIIHAGVEPCDQVIVVTDGDRPWVADLVDNILLPCDVLVTASTLSNDSGNTPRNVGMGLATRSHLHFADDDDIYTPGALTTIRTAIRNEPAALHAFRFHRPERQGIVPRVLRVEPGNVGTPSIAYPNVPARLAKWGHDSKLGLGFSDYEFIARTVALHGGPTCIRWHSDIIYVARPGS